MSEMVRHRGIIKKLSTDKESSREVYKQLIAEGKIEDKWHELDDDGTPRYLDTDNYTVVGDCIFDITGAPREYDGEDDVNDAERLNETDYKIHSYFYNGGASLNEMLEESIPKADAAFSKSTSNLTIEFPSDAHREAFCDWLSNSGEQDHYRQMDYDEKDKEYLYRLNYNYLESSEGIVKAEQIDE